MKSTTVIIADAPEVNLSGTEKAGEVLLKFYRELGWNGSDMLDPCKIRTTKAVYNRLYDAMLDICPDPVGVGMAMISRGPGADDDVPAGKVYLYQGWTKTTETEEGEEKNESI
jgi:hypothetical protein